MHPYALLASLALHLGVLVWLVAAMPDFGDELRSGDAVTVDVVLEEADTPPQIPAEAAPLPERAPTRTAAPAPDADEPSPEPPGTPTPEVARVEETETPPPPQPEPEPEPQPEPTAATEPEPEPVVIEQPEPEIDVTIKAVDLEILTGNELVASLPLVNAVFFDRGKSVIPDYYRITTGEIPESDMNGIDIHKHVLPRIEEIVNKNPNSKIILEGATSGAEYEPEGLKLARARAKSVREAFIGLGVPDSKISISPRIQPRYPSN